MEHAASDHALIYVDLDLYAPAHRGVGVVRGPGDPVAGASGAERARRCRGRGHGDGGAGRAVVPPRAAVLARAPCRKPGLPKLPAPGEALLTKVFTPSAIFFFACVGLGLREPAVLDGLVDARVRGRRQRGVDGRRRPCPSASRAPRAWCRRAGRSRTSSSLIPSTFAASSSAAEEAEPVAALDEAVVPPSGPPFLPSVSATLSAWASVSVLSSTRPWSESRIAPTRSLTASPGLLPVAVAASAGIPTRVTPSGGEAGGRGHGDRGETAGHGQEPPCSAVRHGAAGRIPADHRRQPGRGCVNLANPVNHGRSSGRTGE